MAYTLPTPNDLKARYPAFAGVLDATVQIYLTDAQTSVDESWPEADYIPALCAKAAHEMALLGIGERSEVDGYAAAGVTSIRSADFSVQLDARKVGRASGTGLDATTYGAAYKRILRRVKGGPRVVVASGGCGAEGVLGRQNDGCIVPWGC